MAWVYILECSDGSLYVGSTKNLDRRLWQHQNGEGAKYTQRRRPVRLVWCLVFDRIDEAWAFEKRVQTWGRAKRLALIEGRVEDLPRLASRSHQAITDRRRPEGPSVS
jgi:putative endonuclease